MKLYSTPLASADIQFSSLRQTAVYNPTHYGRQPYTTPLGIAEAIHNITHYSIKLHSLAPIAVRNTSYSNSE